MYFSRRHASKYEVSLLSCGVLVYIVQILNSAMEQKMTGSYTYVDTITETYTHAKRLASKVATDLKRMQRQCSVGKPSDQHIAELELEAQVFISTGFLNEIKYGFQRNGLWIEPTIKYTAHELYQHVSDDMPGGIYQTYNVNGAQFCSYLCYKDRWWLLTDVQRLTIERRLPFKRSTGQDACFKGVMTNDRNYSSGNLALTRSILGSY